MPPEYSPRSGGSNKLSESQTSRSCELFRLALSRGERPAIDRYVEDLQEPDRTLVTRELIRALVDHSRDSGATLDQEDLVRRYPAHKDLIAEILSVGESIRQLGDYELRSCLGRGGMGQVWLAWHRRLKRLVAVKLLNDNNADQHRVIERFEREISTLASLDHPNIVKVLDARLIEGEYLLVMEYVEGVGLDRIVGELANQGRTLAVPDACELVRQAAEGLHYAYERNIVHRDIKPSNLILDRKGVVKILDFGLARDADAGDQSLTDARGLLGTLDYMAPEQFEDPHRVGTPADIYSLGCTLFCLLSGRPPYANVTGGAFAKARAHCDLSQKPPALNKSRDDVDGQLSRILRKMMAKKVDHRYEAPAEVADALAPSCDGSNLLVLPQSLGMSENRLAIEETRNTRSRPASGSTRRDSALKPNRRQFTRWSLGVAALAGATGSALWWNLRTRPRPELASLAMTWGTLPGLSGKWWFDEVPNFVPSVRLAWMERILEESRGEDASTRSLAELPVDRLSHLATSSEAGLLNDELTQKLVPQFPGEASSAIIHGNRLNGADIDRLTYCRHLHETLGQIGATRSKELPPAADLHFAAILAHKLAMLTDSSFISADDETKFLTRAEYWNASQTHYENAVAAYRAEADRSEDESHAAACRAMSKFCIADLAVMYCDRTRWRDAEYLFKSLKLTDAEAGKTLDPLFRLYCLARLGEAQTRQHLWLDAEVTFEVAEGISEVPADHPLRAYIFERRAWHCMSRGDAVDEARSYFQKANEIRVPAAMNDLRQRMFQYHNEHGIGVALQWKKQYAESRSQFQTVLKDIEAEITRIDQEARPGKRFPWQQYRLELVSRYVNSKQRLADSYLFSPDPDFREAAEQFRTGVQFAVDRKLSESLLLGAVASMEYRRAVALRMADGVNQPVSAEVQSAVQSAEAYTTKFADPAEKKPLEFAKLCVALLQRGPQEPNSAELEAVRSYLRKKKASNPDDQRLVGKVNFAYLDRDDRQLATLLSNHFPLEDTNNAA